MINTTIFPARNLNLRPAFWGVDRDLKDVIDSMESTWNGIHLTKKEALMKETENAFFISLDMPGVNKNNLELNIEGDKILIKAIQKNLFSDKNEEQFEINKSVLMPSKVDPDKVQAHCEDGVLYIAMPKYEKARPKKIELVEGFKNTMWNNLLDDRKETSK